MGKSTKGRKTSKAVSGKAGDSCDIETIVDHYTYLTKWSNEDKCYISECLELPGLKAHGKTQLMSLREIREAASGAIELLVSSGEEIPESLGEREFSGKLSVRMSPEEHRELAIDAARNNVSINHLIVSRSLMK